MQGTAISGKAVLGAEKSMPRLSCANLLLVISFGDLAEDESFEMFFMMPVSSMRDMWDRIESRLAGADYDHDN